MQKVLSLQMSVTGWAAGEIRHGKFNVSLYVGCGGGNLSWSGAWGAASVLPPCFLSLACTPVHSYIICVCVHQRALEALPLHERGIEEGMPDDMRVGCFVAEAAFLLLLKFS